MSNILIRSLNLFVMRIQCFKSRVKRWSEKNEKLARYENLVKKSGKNLW